MPVRVCFVCLGNICRSPTADGVMRHLLRQRGREDALVVDSAGTSAAHVGEPADPRSAEEARRRGYHLPSRSRKFVDADWQRFDVVLAMDRSNLRALKAMPGAASFSGTLALFRDRDPHGAGKDTPDPYYGGAQGFAHVLDICERTCAAWLDHLL